MVPDLNFYVWSYMKYWPWYNNWGKLLSMQLQKDIDWEFPPDENCWVCNCDTINMGIRHIFIPLCHLIYASVKYPCDTIFMVTSQGQITLRHLTLREGIIYNHWLVNYTRTLIKIMTCITWNIQLQGVYLDMKRFSMQFQSQFLHWGWTWRDWRNIPIYNYTHQLWQKGYGDTLPLCIIQEYYSKGRAPIMICSYRCYVVIIE